MKELIGITVREALDLDNMKKIKLLAGADGVERRITKLNIMEVPDIVDWVEKGELLFTTLYSIKDDEIALRTLIPSLVKKELAGLAIKPGRYIKEIPSFMIKQAEEYNFPLLQVPYSFSYSELINSVSSKILDVQTEFLRKTLNIHEELTDIILYREGLEKLADVLAEMIDNPIMITDNNNNILSINIPLEISEEVNEEELYATIERQEGFSFSNVETPSSKQKNIKINGEIYNLHAIPIITSNSFYGYLYAWDICSEINILDLATLKWASTIAALDILNQQAISEVERRYKNELLYDILKGKIEERDTLLKRGERIGWNFDKGYMVVLIDLKKLINREMKKKVLSQNIQKTVLNRISVLDGPDLITGDIGTYVVLLYPGDVDDNEYCQKEIVDYINNVLAIFNKKEDRSLIKVGVGTFIDNIVNIKQGYYQAKRAISVSYKLKDEDKLIYFFDKLGVYKLLYNVEEDDLRSFLINTINPLIKYDEDHNTELVKTLQAYFEENGNLTNIAKKLFIHYNTALYRLQRIEKITGFEMNDANDRLNLEVALKLMSLAEMESSW